MEIVGVIIIGILLLVAVIWVANYMVEKTGLTWGVAIVGAIIFVVVLAGMFGLNLCGSC